MSAVRIRSITDVPERYRARVAGWDAGLRRAMRTIATQVERGMDRNLSGPGGFRSPGSYPVPRRSGFLARSGYSKSWPRRAEVGNTAEYAAAVHGGFRAYGNPSAPYYGPRPYLDDAAVAVDHMAIIQAELERVP